MKSGLSLLMAGVLTFAATSVMAVPVGGHKSFDSAVVSSESEPESPTRGLEEAPWTQAPKPVLKTSFLTCYSLCTASCNSEYNSCIQRCHSPSCEWGCELEAEGCYEFCWFACSY